MKFSDIKDNVKITNPKEDIWVVKITGRIKYFARFLKYCKSKGAKYSKKMDGIVFEYDPADVLSKFEYTGKRVGRPKGSITKKKSRKKKSNNPKVEPEGKESWEITKKEKVETYSDFNDFLKKRYGYDKWYKSNNPIKRLEGIGTKRINNKTFDKLDREYKILSKDKLVQEIAEREKNLTNFTGIRRETEEVVIRYKKEELKEAIKWAKEDEPKEITGVGKPEKTTEPTLSESDYITIQIKPKDEYLGGKPDEYLAYLQKNMREKQNNLKLGLITSAIYNNVGDFLDKWATKGMMYKGDIEKDIADGLNIDLSKSKKPLDEVALLHFELNKLYKQFWKPGHKKDNDMKTEKPKELSEIVKEPESKKFDDWLTIPDALKYSKPVISKPFEFSPYDKNLLAIVEPFTIDDKFRIMFSAIYFDENGATATDAHKLIHLQKIGNGKLNYEGAYCTTKRCVGWKNEIGTDINIKDDIIKGDFPKYENIIPTDIPFIYEVDFLKLKTYCEILINSGFVNKIHYLMQFTYGDDNVIGLKGNFVIDCCKAMLQLGYNKGYIGVIDPLRPIMFTPNKESLVRGRFVGETDFILLMPMEIKDVPAEITNEDNQGDFDLGQTINIYYDFRTNKVLTNGGKISHDINTSIRARDIKGQGGLSTDEIRMLKNIIKKTNVLPILDYYKVENGVLIKSDLSFWYIKKGLTFEDGLYSMAKGALIKSINKDPFPVLPDKEEAKKIGNVNKNEFMFKWGNAMKCIGSDELRPALSSINLENKSGKLEIKATDANIIFYEEIQNHDTVEFEALIPYAKDVYLALNTMECEEIGIYMSGKNIWLDCGAGEIIIRLSDDKYPDFKGILGDLNLTQKLTFDKKELDGLVKGIKKSSFDYLKFEMLNDKAILYSEEQYLHSSRSEKIGEIKLTISKVEPFVERKGIYVGFPDGRMKIHTYLTLSEIIKDDTISFYRSTDKTKYINYVTGKSDTTFAEIGNIKKTEKQEVKKVLKDKKVKSKVSVKKIRTVIAVKKTVAKDKKMKIAKAKASARSRRLRLLKF